MSTRNTRTIVAAVKLAIFTVISILVTGLLAVIMGNVGFGDKRTVNAEFTSASMLQEGDDVRIAGIPVGEVKEIELHERSRAMVTFTVAADVPLTTNSRAEIRYLNVVGDRYLALEEGPKGGKRLGDDATMPVSRTEPALDLTALYNGFQPLFSALDPKAVNELSQNIIDVLQGESGTVQGLLARTASLTNTLANRDELIGDVITNLDELLGTVDRRRTQLSELVLGLEEWMGNLAEDRDVIGTSVQNLSELTDTVADLLTRARPLLAEDVRELRTLVRTLSKQENLEVLTKLLDRLPEAMTDQTRIGTYGSWYNYYLCDFEGSIKLPKILGIDLGWLEDALNDLSFHSTAPRCQ
ncbi:MCE family protein [Nocardioides deserti]|uniref:MCE family protein n=1 Tax=Nocardioides deserti TaxID=1588644 RepID=A0ABR6U4S5_9ACTN|nr:MlaD family protein [Nocardioides deserti]MBC2958974.1 MCE family protein [Nocardioides deserti]GGO69095.1 ABC transporter substrate-binding protein [Nocardioides deserti]